MKIPGMRLLNRVGSFFSTAIGIAKAVVLGLIAAVAIGAICVIAGLSLPITGGIALGVALFVGIYEMPFDVFPKRSSRKTHSRSTAPPEVEPIQKEASPKIQKEYTPLPDNGQVDNNDRQPDEDDDDVPSEGQEKQGDDMQKLLAEMMGGEAPKENDTNKTEYNDHRPERTPPKSLSQNSSRR